MVYLAVVGTRQLLSVCCDEIDALMRMYGVEPRECYERPTRQDCQADPFMLINIPNREVASKIAERSVTLKALVELWTVHDCRSIHEAVASLASCSKDIMEPFLDPAITWRVNVTPYKSSLSMSETAAVRNHFLPLMPFTGPIRLKDAECKLTMSVFVEFADSDKSRAVGDVESAHTTPTLPRFEGSIPHFDHLGEEQESCRGTRCCDAYKEAEPAPAVAEVVHADSVPPAKRARKTDENKHKPAHPAVKRVFVGRDVGRTSRYLLTELQLKSRPFLGPTSLDPELALLMSNIAAVRSHDLIYDPFVGSGSILVAAQRLTGCVALGSDIDAKILKGRDGKDIWSNFAHYGMELPEICRLDNAHPAMRQGAWFDAIVTDPPYGVRAGARKSGVPTEKYVPIPDEYRDEHVPRTQVYKEDDVMFDMLNRAAKLLVLGGRIVYLYPALFSHTSSQLPVHPCLTLISDSEEKLTPVLSRRIVCLRKTTDYDETQIDAYRRHAVDAAVAAGTYGVSIKARLGSAYETWYSAHKEDYDTKALCLTLYGTKSGFEIPAGKRPEEAVEDLEKEMDERHGTSRKALKLHRKRLLRQLIRSGDIVLTGKEKENGGAGGPPS